MFLSMGLDGRFKVALRKESVDRNRNHAAQLDPVRRVALRKESVDRNHTICADHHKRRLSLSARRAWIEIINNNYNDLTRPCRSPQGERG